MNLIARLYTKIFNPGLARYLESSIRYLEGAGMHGTKPRPFDNSKAVQEFRSWVYSAAMLNAQAVASVPLRLYTKTGKGEKLFQTKKVSSRRKRYLLGQNEIKPSNLVVQKIQAMGEDFEEVDNTHPVIEILRNPTAWMSGYDLTILRVIYGELTGNAYLHSIKDNAGFPQELWLMPPQWVWIIPDKVEFIKGYAYGQTLNDAKIFSPDEVIHFKRPNPKDLFYGMGKVEAGWGVISQNTAIHEMDLAFYDNMARPDYAVIVKSGASEEMLTKFERKMNSKLKGSANAGKFLAITGDVELKSLNFPPKDLAGRTDIVEEIASIMGVPVGKLRANDPIKANAEESNIGWMRDTILPLCRFDEDVLNSRLLPMYETGDNLVLAYDDPVPTNKEFNVSRRVQLVTSGIITPNEAREEEGYEAIDGADYLATPQNNSGLAPVEEVQSIDESDNAGEQTSATAQRDFNGAQVTSALETLRAVTDGTLSAEAAISMLVEFFGIAEERARAMVAAQMKQRAIILAENETNVADNQNANSISGEDDEQDDNDDGKRKMQAKQTPAPSKEEIKNQPPRRVPKLAINAMHEAVKKWGKKTIEILETDIEASTPNGVAVVDGWKWDIVINDGKTELEPEMVHALDVGAKVAGTRLGELASSWDVRSEQAIEWAKRYVGKQVTVVTNQSRNALRNVIVRGLERGDSIDDIKKKLKQIVGLNEPQGSALDRFEREMTDEGLPATEIDLKLDRYKNQLLNWRTETIARTETAKAYCEGERELYKNSNIKQMEWIVSPDGCPICLDEAAQQPIWAIEDAAEVLPRHPSCRCDWAPVIEE